MNSDIIILRAETFAHPGVGQSTGALDLPVARERTTDFPFIPGSGVKGAFRVWAAEQARLEKEENWLFGDDVQKVDGGNPGAAGAALFSDARLLLLPVRCVTDVFKWITCPLLLQRFRRDCARAGVDIGLPENITVPSGQYLGGNTQESNLELEERQFARNEGCEINPDILTALDKALPLTQQELADRLVILNDADFAWFARYALPVMARNRLDKNKRVETGALWYEETLPPDTIMHVLLAERRIDAKAKEGDGAEKEKKSSPVAILTRAIADAPYIQMGGNETIGQGWFYLHTLKEGGNGQA